MAAGGQGYFHANYFHNDYWHQNYWADQPTAVPTGPPVGTLACMGCGRILIPFTYFIMRALNE